MDFNLATSGVHYFQVSDQVQDYISLKFMVPLIFRSATSVSEQMLARGAWAEQSRLGLCIALAGTELPVDL